jgi:FMN phosphatase YigB (HAD superfamily)
VASSDYGIRKPDLQIVWVALTKIGHDHGAVCFVGDRLDNDVQGSTQVVMTPVWYNRRGLPNAQNSPCLEVKIVTGLSRMLRALPMPRHDITQADSPGNGSTVGLPPDR